MAKPVIRKGRGEHAVSPEARRRGHEPTDVSVRGVLGVAALFIGTIAVSGAILAGLLALSRDEIRENRPPPSPLDLVDVIPPEPRLQAEPVEELARVLAPQFELLNGYGWIEPGAGVARIPIERAMAILAERGWPAVPEGEAWGGPPARPEPRPELQRLLQEGLSGEEEVSPP